MVDHNRGGTEGEKAPVERKPLAKPAEAVRLDEGMPVGLEVRNNLIPQGMEAHSELSGDRYGLNALILTSKEDVEEFDQEFSDVVAISRWLPRTALLQLWPASTDS